MPGLSLERSMVGEYLVSEELMDAARFMLVLKGMLDHEVRLLGSLGLYQR